MIGYYNYTVILTYIGTMFGFIGLINTLQANLKISLLCLMLAGFCDMFDGKIAATMERNRQEKRFGIQIDSLSDLICFGVLPALIVYQYSAGKMLQVFVCAVYVLCALIRLAWFNVDEEERQNIEKDSRKNYLGLPVTSVALLLPLFIGSFQLMQLPVDKLSPCLLLGIAAAFLSPFCLKKPGALGTVLMSLCGLAALGLLMLV